MVHPPKEHTPETPTAEPAPNGPGDASPPAGAGSGAPSEKSPGRVSRVILGKLSDQAFRQRWYATVKIALIAVDQIAALHGWR